MGIKGLNSWIASTFPGVMEDAPQVGRRGGGGGGGGRGHQQQQHQQRRGGRTPSSSSAPPPPSRSRPPLPYDHVLFDANGMVHQACRRSSTETHVLREIIRELDAVLRRHPPRLTVLVALDGPGPNAKLFEQRKRRIGKVLKGRRDVEARIVGSVEYERRKEIALGEGKTWPPPPLGRAKLKKRKRGCLDSLQVTPGTGFMLRLRRALEWYAVSRLGGGGEAPAGWTAARSGGGGGGVGGAAGGPAAARPTNTSPLVFVSAANVPGEGEVKCLQHLHAAHRWQQQQKPGAGPPSFLLVGPDADLLLLGLASGTPHCDVLTIDRNGRDRLFRVSVLCEMLDAQLGPPYGTSNTNDCTPVVGGGLHQLDFLVIAFLQGNDYLPKLRGANLPRMWRRLCKLLNMEEWRGQHLLNTRDGRVVEVNLRLLVALTGGCCIEIEEGEGEEEEDGAFEDEEGEEGDGSGNGEHVHAAAPDVEVGESNTERPDSSTDPPPVGAVAPGQKRPRHVGDADVRDSVVASGGSNGSAGADPELYLRCLAWCAAMYLTGTCPDYSETYPRRRAPTALQLARYEQQQREAGGAEGRRRGAPPPRYEIPTLPPHAAADGRGPLPADVFSLCLLPGEASEYVPRPLRKLMVEGGPLSDIFHDADPAPRDLVARVREAVDAVGKQGWSREDATAVARGTNVVFGSLRGGRNRGGGNCHPFLLASGRSLAPLSVMPPSPLGPTKGGHNGGGGKGGSVGSVSTEPDTRGAPLQRWAWDDAVGAGSGKGYKHTCSCVGPCQCFASAEASGGAKAAAPSPARSNSRSARNPSRRCAAVPSITITTQRL